MLHKTKAEAINRQTLVTLKPGCHDIQHNNIQHNDIQHNETQHNNILQNKNST